MKNCLDISSILGVTADSGRVKAGFVFVAVQGESRDGHEFIGVAVQKGARAIVGERELNSALVSVLGEVPYYQVKDARLELARLASAFYGNPSQDLLMVGVTGTSGKTTTTYLIESILKAAGHRVGMIGTVGFRVGSKVYPATHTTPGSVELQALLCEMKESGCTAVVMEVSSHALKQHRAASIAFDGMVFTNLSPEHLDFHPDMEDYFSSKKILFTQIADYSLQSGKKPVAAVNADDSYGQRLLRELKTQSPELEARSFSLSSNLYGSLSLSVEGISGVYGGLSIQSKLIGDFNASNIAAAVTLAQELRIPPQFIEKGIRDLAGVPGRMERVENPSGIHVWVDYAHKPDALAKVIEMLKKIRSEHRLITVFGCGGDRDRKKRPLMGKIAVQGSDYVFITSDNPRTENPLGIIEEIVKGTEQAQNFKVQSDRKKAIFEALQLARPGDLVLIAGKGHEDYQILGTEKVHFDDREAAAEFFASEKCSNA